LEVPDDVDAPDKGSESHDRTTDDLEKQCETLQQRLNQVQQEILKLLSEKRACSEENCALKMKISELMKHLPSRDLKKVADKSAHSSMETIRIDGNAPWPHRGSSEDSSKSETLKADSPILEDSAALKYIETERSEIPEMHSDRTQTVNTSCSSVFATVSEEENEMEWKTISDNCKSSGSLGDDEGISEDSHSSIKFDKLLHDYNRLTQENKTLKEKCNELSSCLDMLRNEYDQCEEYWASKLDEERRLYEEVSKILLKQTTGIISYKYVDRIFCSSVQEQRISDEKFVELQQKIEEYSEMYDTETMASQLSCKLPPIAENDCLEKEVCSIPTYTTCKDDNGWSLLVVEGRMELKKYPSF